MWKKCWRSKKSENLKIDFSRDIMRIVKLSRGHERVKFWCQTLQRENKVSKNWFNRTFLVIRILVGLKSWLDCRGLTGFFWPKWPKMSLLAAFSRKRLGVTKIERRHHFLLLQNFTLKFRSVCQGLIHVIKFPTR